MKDAKGYTPPTYGAGRTNRSGGFLTTFSPTALVVIRNSAGTQLVSMTGQDGNWVMLDLKSLGYELTKVGSTQRQIEKKCINTTKKNLSGLRNSGKKEEQDTSTSLRTTEVTT